MRNSSKQLHHIALLALLFSLMAFPALSAKHAAIVPSAEHTSPAAPTQDAQADSALAFLYRYMALPDSTDHDRDFYEKQIKVTLRARKEMPWGQTIPEREWVHFVLPVRVNNEDLDDSRTWMYEALKPRVEHLTMEQAVLEVNHWCHEHVSYQPSDARTHGPLASINSAIGRCGEESTFTVSALRSVGIPARQVYTPRWAHTDDNHAWVEAWVDGRWRFMGACEPEPVLDLGWFNAPASRAMLMHTKAYGRYDGPERKMRRTACYTEIDVTDTYAPTAIVTVQTTDAAGHPVPATVQFRLYNYGEFYDLLWVATNEQGICDFKSGLGDLLIWASDGNHFGFEKVHVGDVDTVHIALRHTAEEMNEQRIALDITPPVERNTVPAMTPEQIALNKQRFAREDSIRNEYIATFFTQEKALKWAKSVELKSVELKEVKSVESRDSLVADLLVKSRGNHAVITKFLTEAEDKVKAVRLLTYINEKDLRDVPLDVLRDHYNNCASLSEYILNPRVSMELLTPYRKALQEGIPQLDQQRYRENPSLWEQWCKEKIKIDFDRNPQNVYMHPLSVWQNRICDKQSRNIFFVAAARSMGIEARIDEVTGKVQWRNSNKEWHTAFEEKSNRDASHQGTLNLTYTPNEILNDPIYNTHFTLSRIEEGYPVLLNYPECQPFSKIFSEPVQLDEGDYVLTTGTRLAKGGVLSEMTFFSIKDGENKTLPITFRASTDEVQVIGNFSCETPYLPVKGVGNKCSTASDEATLLSTTGRGYYIIGRLNVGTEPTNHALKDISAVRKELDKIGRPILLICNSVEEIKKVQHDFPDLPSVVHYGIDKDNKVAQGMQHAVQSEEATRMPVFLITDTFDRVVFLRQGYTINLGDQLLKVLKKI